MLDAIRKRTGSIVVKLLLGLLVLSFGAWGIGDYLNGNVGGSAVATVGEREIPAQVVSRELQREVNRLRQYLGDAATMETVRSFGLDQQVIGRLVQAQLYSLAAQSHGLVVSDADVRAQIQGMQAFKGITGSFDRDVFRQTIANAGYSENGFVELIRDETKQQHVLGSLQSGVAAPSVLVEQIYAYRNEVRDAQFTTILDAGFDVATPDDAAIAAYHQDQQSKFMAPAYRDVTFIHLRAEDLIDGIDVSDEDLEDAYGAREAEFVTQARRNVEQAIFDTEEHANTAMAMMNGGQAFAQVALALTGADAGTLSLGWVTPDQLLGEDAAEAVFSTAPGNLAGPVKSMLGWHVFNVVDGVEETVKSLADVADTLRHDVALDRALDDLFGMANQVEDLLASGNTLEEVGATLDLAVTTVMALDQSGSDSSGAMLDNLPGQGFLETVFATEEGQESPLVESGNDAYFITRVNGVTDPALRPLDTVRSDVIEAMVADAQDAMAKEAANAIADDLSSSADLLSLVADYGGDLVNGEGFKRDGSNLPQNIPPQIAEALFGKNVGDGAVVRRGDGYVVGHLKSISGAAINHSDPAFATLRDELAQKLRGDIVDQLSVALEIRHPVSVNQSALTQIQGSF